MLSEPALELVANIGFVLEFIGKLLVSFTAVSVHHRFWKEHKVDEKVFREMHREQNLGLIGIAFMTVGFVMEMFYNLVH